MKGPYYVVNIQHAVTALGNDEYVESLLECGAQYVRLNCAGRSCDRCLRDTKVYRVCPSCGKDAVCLGSVICSCGAWLYVCRGPAVAHYVIPSPMMKEMMKDDAI